MVYRVIANDFSPKAEVEQWHTSSVDSIWLIPYSFTDILKNQRNDHDLHSFLSFQLLDFL